MRMPFYEFITNGDLKFVIVLIAFLIAAFVFFYQQFTQKISIEIFQKKLKNLVKWSLLISVFSLFLGLLHSFYFVSKANGIATPLLFSGLANMLITPTLGVAIAMGIKLMTILPNKKQINHD